VFEVYCFYPLIFKFLTHRDDFNQIGTHSYYCNTQNIPDLPENECAKTFLVAPVLQKPWRHRLKKTAVIEFEEQILHPSERNEGRPPKDTSTGIIDKQLSSS